ncbi:hypothetical protein [Desulfatibacillum aliphaticivorans]|uniref:hypothetical protein n=1 Tax=Desulfatibacillum aliphaticivorans TaxID=218208 RepID=UPI000425D057|nr:hypothetical protein [Desulfatibacillum aliphaticivorans]
MAWVSSQAALAFLCTTLFILPLTLLLADRTIFSTAAPFASSVILRHLLVAMSAAILLRAMADDLSRYSKYCSRLIL